MMTRKDYVNVSDILASYAKHMEPNTFARMVDAFADYMASDNPRFDRQRFFDACSGVKA